jgi:hypothetical protein
MSDGPDLPPHWQFALASALGRLEQLIWHLDELTQKWTFAVLGVPNPEKLLTVIDGFLQEEKALYQGDIARLRKMRDHVRQAVAPAYESGRDAAAEIWSSAPPDDQRKFLKTPDELILAEVQKHLQKVNIEGLAERAWFIEGFFLQWRDETLAFLARYGLDS